MSPLLQSFLGGLVIGTAAATLLLVSGRIAGVSGILGSTLGRDAGPGGWRPAFLLGLVAAPVVAHAIGIAGERPVFAGGLGLAVVAGLVTGYGAGLAHGCTSGHGVCGIANVSPRSLAATVTFMVMAGITVFVVRHVIGASA
jgi:uncharacterized membrane protein YedE/YeeE